MSDADVVVVGAGLLLHKRGAQAAFHQQRREGGEDQQHRHQAEIGRGKQAGQHHRDGDLHAIAGADLERTPPDGVRGAMGGGPVGFQAVDCAF